MPNITLFPSYIHPSGVFCNVGVALVYFRPCFPVTSLCIMMPYFLFLCIMMPYFLFLCIMMPYFLFLCKLLCCRIFYFRPCFPVTSLCIMMPYFLFLCIMLPYFLLQTLFPSDKFMYYDALFSVDYRAVEDDVGLGYNSFQTDDFKPQGKIVHTCILSSIWLSLYLSLMFWRSQGDTEIHSSFSLSLLQSIFHKFHLFKSSKELKMNFYTCIHCSSFDKALFL